MIQHLEKYKSLSGSIYFEIFTFSLFGPTMKKKKKVFRGLFYLASEDLMFFSYLYIFIVLDLFPVFPDIYIH